MTPAEELRAAAAKLRCEHSFPVQPPEGHPWAPGPCSHCGITCLDSNVIRRRSVLESLASLLEDLSRLAVDHLIDPGYAGMPVHRWCTGCDNEECDALQIVDRAREVVGALNGTVPAATAKAGA